MTRKLTSEQQPVMVDDEVDRLRVEVRRLGAALEASETKLTALYRALIRWSSDKEWWTCRVCGEGINTHYETCPIAAYDDAAIRARTGMEK